MMRGDNLLCTNFPEMWVPLSLQLANRTARLRHRLRRRILLILGGPGFRAPKPKLSGRRYAVVSAGCTGLHAVTLVQFHRHGKPQCFFRDNEHRFLMLVHPPG
jgi:hypothetical protein